MKKFSVIITHFKREENLENTLKGLALQTIVPEEVIVVDMGGPIEQSNIFPFRLRIVPYLNEWRNLPLAAARNLGALHCRQDVLMFLDVDCIPSLHYCEKMAHAAQQKGDALIMGTPRYMLYHKDRSTEFQDLREHSVHHPSRPVVHGVIPETCYELFWSLCFTISKTTFLNVGGFDEGYEGYGAEDTDFALQIKMAGVPFYLSCAEVFHQQHPIYVPPVNHLEPIVNNCNLFYSKWGYWPMADCLEAFTSMDYIKWKPDQRQSIEIESRPSQVQIKKQLLMNAPYR